MYKHKRCIVLAAVLFILPFFAYSQTASLSVWLRNTSEEPITGGNLCLLTDTARFCAVEKSPGNYQITSIQPGTYTMEVAAFRYQQKSTSIKIDDGVNNIFLHLSFAYHTLDDVVVTGRLADKNLRASNLAIKTLHDDEMRKNLGGSLVETLTKIPGVEMMGIGAAQSKPIIRGLGFDRVLVIDKGVKHEAQQWGADHGLEIDQFSVNQVEVIKGPASFLYGSNAIGGVLKIHPAPIPAKASSGGSVQLVGKWANRFGGLATDFYTRKNKWFATAGFSLQDYADYKVPADSIFVYDYSVKLHNRTLRNTAGMQTGFNFSGGFIADNFQNVVYVSNVFSKNGLFANAHGLEPKKVNEAIYDQSSRDILDPSDRVNHFKIIQHTSFSIRRNAIDIRLGYQHNHRHEFSAYIPHGYMPATYPAPNGIPQNLEREYQKQVFSFQLQNHRNIASHDVMVGTDGEMQINEIGGWSFLTPAYKQYAAGFFVYDKIKQNDRLVFHIAARTDITYIDVRGYRDWFYSPLPGGAQEMLERASPMKKSFSSLTGSLGITYNLARWMFKANIGKSFRVPIAKELAANGVNYHYFSFEKGNPNLNAEQSWQLDVFASFKNEKWRVEMSPFINYFPNYIYLNPTAYHDYFYGAGNQVFQYSQSEVFRAGGELEVYYRFLPSLSATITGEYVYAHQLSGDKAGYSLPFSPPASAVVSISYEPQRVKRMSEVYMSADMRLVAPQNNIVPPEKKSAGYVVVDFQAGNHFHFGRQRFDVNFQVRNLLNASYLMHTSFYRLIGLPEEGIDFVLSMKMNFNFSKK